jgi:hypothetical protein
MEKYDAHSASQHSGIRATGRELLRGEGMLQVGMLQERKHSHRPWRLCGSDARQRLLRRSEDTAAGAGAGAAGADLRIYKIRLMH